MHMTQRSEEQQAGSGGPTNGPRTRGTAITSSPAAGPTLAAARSIVASLDPVAYVYASLGITTEADERDLRSRGSVKNLLQQGASEQAATAIAARIAAAPPTPAILAAFAARDGTLLYEQILADAEVPDEAGCQSPPPVTRLHHRRCRGRPAGADLDRRWPGRRDRAKAGARWMVAAELPAPGRGQLAPQRRPRG